ncbi:hypothetical protein SAMD00023353_2001380 [Rosellinia necatrix]|uniref:Uncharacterized protein n=1 Tax=Rosellinia necatrix TaxID=77044 RepID=A0A1W2TEY4_ROSNE|nr:hypothetical protein SAMD00023353_2001380 [Rosellinia necatrix]
MSPTTYQSPYKPTPTSTLADTCVRWIRLKKYRIEVTYGVYVFTPNERIVFWTIFCILSSLIVTTALVYAQRSLLFLLRAIVSCASGSLPPGFPGTKYTVTELTASAARMEGIGGAMKLMRSTARNSQAAA